MATDLPSPDTASYYDRASSRLIGIALGIIVERYRVTCDDALAVLRDASRCSDRQMYDVAAEIVDTGVIPWADDGRGIRYRSRPGATELLT